MSGPMGGNPGAQPRAGKGNSQRKMPLKGLRMGSFVLICYREKRGHQDEKVDYEGTIVDKRVGWDNRESYVELKDCVKLNRDGEIIAREGKKKLIDAFIDDCEAADSDMADILNKYKKNEWKKGDLVDIWSSSEKKWFTDGVLEEVRGGTSSTADGKELPPGCVKVVYGNGLRGKWIHPDAMNDEAQVKRAEKPEVFSGFLLKETHKFRKDWHMRYFEVKDGFLTWWVTQEDAKNGVKPQSSLSLVGLMMKIKKSSTQFGVRTASSKGVVYNLDCSHVPGTKYLAQWVEALKLHSAYSNRTQKITQK